MTCAYLDPHGGSCQFQDGNLLEYRGEPIYFGGKWWCRFHLPAWDEDWKVLRDEYGPSPKGRWTGGKDDAFVSTVRTIISESTEDDPAILVGIVLPLGFDGTEMGQVFFTILDDASFAPYTRFCATQFLGMALFTGARFGKGIDFQDVVFGDSVNFIAASFDKQANFDNVRFRKYVEFDGAEFGGSVNFKNVWFEGQATFNNATFHGDTSFRDAYFGGSISFQDARFCDSVTFESGSIFPWESNVTERANIFRVASFHGTIFDKNVSFSNRQFLERVDFSGSIFGGIPDFHAAVLHQDTDFQGASFKISEWEDDQEAGRAERAYRTLKLAMAEQHASNEQARFFAYELECLRQQRSAPFFSRLMARLYKDGSDYGRSMARPLFWWGLMFAVGAVALALLQALGGTVAMGDAVLVMVEQTVRPFFGLLEEGYTPPGEMRALRQAYPVLFRIIVVTYSLLEVGCVALLVLAIRRQFRLS